MAQILIKRATVANHVPAALAVGEVAINVADDPPRAWVGTPGGVKRLFDIETVEDADTDSVYGRCNGDWVPVPIVVDTTPTTAAPNSLWWDSGDGRFFLRFNDQWVEIPAVAGPGGPRGPQGDIGPQGDRGPMGDIESEPKDGHTYARKDGAWQEALSIDGGAVSGALSVAGATSLGATLNVAGTTWVGAFHSYSTISCDTTLTATGAIHSYATVAASGIMSAGGVGLQTTLGGWHHFAFHYNGNCYVNVDNNTGWLIFTAASDERFKQDIAPSTFDCLAAVEKIPLYQFRWMDNSEPGNIKPVEPAPESLIPIGLVAQRVREVAPSLVVDPLPPLFPNATERPQRRDGSAPFSPMQIETNNMLATLIGAIQQLSERVRALEAAHHG